MIKKFFFRQLTLAFGLFLSCSVALADDIEVSDPIEPVNRGIFWFNDKFDIYVLEPVARRYEENVPQPVQKGIGNVFSNLSYPSYLVSDLVQFKFSQALTHTGRFLVNTTLGIGGLVDVAKRWGMEENEEDFGLALAYHGVPAGPYLVLPFVGPSNLRDGIGRLVDLVLDPLNHLTAVGMKPGEAMATSLGTKAIYIVDVRSDLLEAIKAAKESSVDYYLFTQGAYYQYRRGLLYDGNPPDDQEPLD